MDAIKAIPALPVSDMGASVGFFRDTLGFDAVHQEENFAIVRQGAVDLHLWLAADQGWTGRVGDTPVVSGAESFLSGTASCRIQVNEVDGLYEQFQSLGVIHPNGALESTDWRTREFSVVDPDGNLIVFYEVHGGTG